MQAGDAGAAERDHVSVLQQPVRLKKAVKRHAELFGEGQRAPAAHGIGIGRTNGRLRAGQLDQRACAADVVDMPVRVQNQRQILQPEAQTADRIQDQIQGLRVAAVQQDEPRAVSIRCAEAGSVPTK